MSYYAFYVLLDPIVQEKSEQDKNQRRKAKRRAKAISPWRE